MPFPILAIVGLCKICAVVGGVIFCTHKIAKAYEKNQKTKQQKNNAKSQVDLAKIQANQEAINSKQTANEQLKQEKETKISQAEEKEKKLEQAKSKSNDPNISEDERRAWRTKARELEDELNKDRQFIQRINDQIKGNEEDITKSQKTINATGSSFYDNDRHWIWDLFTIENMLIVGACYVLYKLTKDER